MSQKYLWGVPSTTSGWQNYPNGWVYTAGIAMPTPRLDYYGNRPIRIHSFGDGYLTGAGSFFRLNYFGNLVEPGGVMIVNTIGGSFQWEGHQGNVSNQMFFGRDIGAGRTVTSVNDGFVWAGTLAGSFYWDQVPTQPGMSVAINGRNATVTITAPSDNGGTGVDQYVVQYSKDGGAWTGTRYGGTTTYTNLEPGSYRFRTWCHNAVGYSQVRDSGSYTIRSGGKRWTGTAWVELSRLNRRTSTAWADLSIGRKRSASAWTDLG